MVPMHAGLPEEGQTPFLYASEPTPAPRAFIFGP
jgi:hypothetical protein